MIFAMRNVAFRYGEHPVIADFELDLEPGFFHGILGPNGCGKTTVLDLLGGYRQPAQGTIAFRGRPLRRYSRRALAREMALVPQDFYINFPYRSEEIVMMGRYPYIPRFAAPSPQDRKIVAAVMDKTDIRDLGGRFVTELSGGERQRVVFARALAQDTPVLLLDEATSNLDIRHTLSLLSLAAEDVRRYQKTVVAVFQDINLAAQFCDRLVFMQAGQVAALGPVERVLTPATIRAVFGVEARVYDEAFSGRKQVAFRPRAEEHAPSQIGE